MQILQKPPTNLYTPTHLYIDRGDGGPVNVYRMAGDTLEFRVLNADGTALENGSPWRCLSEEEVQWHYDLKTVVSQWLSHRREQYRAAA